MCEFSNVRFRLALSFAIACNFTYLTFVCNSRCNCCVTIDFTGTLRVFAFYQTLFSFVLITFTHFYMSKFNWNTAIVTAIALPIIGPLGAIGCAYIYSHHIAR